MKRYLVLIPILTGCLTGTIQDLEGNTIEGIEVLANFDDGRPQIKATSIRNGVPQYEFDGYDDPDQAVINPTVHKTVELVFWAPNGTDDGDWCPAVYYQEPDYKPYRWEGRTYQVWQLDAVLQRPPCTDTDGDQVPDKTEVAFGTDPRKKDTDGDGASDYCDIYGCQH